MVGPTDLSFVEKLSFIRSAQDQPLNIYINVIVVISYVTTANWIYLLLYREYIQGLFPLKIKKIKKGGWGKQQRQ